MTTSGGERERAETVGESVTRRSVLRAATVAGAIGVAGCSSVTDKTYSASTVTMNDGTMSDLGFEETGSETFTTSESRSVGPLEGSVTAESTLSVFSDGESTPEPSETDRWAESAAPLASWAGNDPVRGVSGSNVFDGGDVTPVSEDVPFESVAADGITFLYPDSAADGGSVSASDTLAMMPADTVQWGEREDGGTVSLENPASVFDAEKFAPENAVFSGQS